MSGLDLIVAAPVAMASDEDRKWWDRRVDEPTTLVDAIEQMRYMREDWVLVAKALGFDTFVDPETIIDAANAIAALSPTPEGDGQYADLYSNGTQIYWQTSARLDEMRLGRYTIAPTYEAGAKDAVMGFDEVRAYTNKHRRNVPIGTRLKSDGRVWNGEEWTHAVAAPPVGRDAVAWQYRDLRSGMNHEWRPTTEAVHDSHLNGSTTGIKDVDWQVRELFATPCGRGERAACHGCVRRFRRCAAVWRRRTSRQGAY